jgi:UDP-N-acetylmuramoylalanine--D-glutamate ligase
MDYSGMNVLIMGLGLNGGGLASAQYLARRGALLTITDLRDEKTLSPSLEKLGNAGGMRLVLGRHEMADFENADMVIKNPGVNPQSPFLKKARRIETDISLFLASSPSRLLAITGSKGKSVTASAAHHALQAARARGVLRGAAFLGGNITVSPLTFLDELTEDDDVVLELSSWQLGDLKDRCEPETHRPLLKPRAAVLTAIMPDHLNWYGSMEAYVADKQTIYRGQDAGDVTVAGSDAWGQSFLQETHGRPLMYTDKPLPSAPTLPNETADGERLLREIRRWLPEGMYGGWLAGGRGFARIGPDAATAEIVPEADLVPGVHQKKNLLAAGLALLDMGLPASVIRESFETFRGIEHRLEFFFEKDNIRFYNDTAATIPEAAAAAVEAFNAPVILVTGGTDKALDFSPLVPAAARAKAVILLAGTGTDKLKPLLEGKGVPYAGPFDRIETAAAASFERAASGDTVVFSPGCASFGMFLNEFDRGDQWKKAVMQLGT